MMLGKYDYSPMDDSVTSRSRSILLVSGGFQDLYALNAHTLQDLQRVQPDRDAFISRRQKELTSVVALTTSDWGVGVVPTIKVDDDDDSDDDRHPETKKSPEAEAGGVGVHYWELPPNARPRCESVVKTTWGSERVIVVPDGCADEPSIVTSDEHSDDGDRGPLCLRQVSLRDAFSTRTFRKGQSKQKTLQPKTTTETYRVVCQEHHKDSISAIGWVGGASRSLVLSGDESESPAVIWDIKKGKKVHVLKGSEGTCFVLRMLGGGEAFVASGDTVFRYDMTKLTRTQVARSRGGDVDGLDVVDDRSTGGYSKLLCVAAGGRDADLIALDTGRPVRGVSTSRTIGSALFATDRHRLFLGTYGGFVSVFDLRKLDQEFRSIPSLGDYNNGTFRLVRVDDNVFCSVAWQHTFKLFDSEGDLLGARHVYFEQTVHGCYGACVVKSDAESLERARRVDEVLPFLTSLPDSLSQWEMKVRLLLSSRVALLSLWRSFFVVK